MTLIECISVGCPGHQEPLDVILHCLYALDTRLAAVEEDLGGIKRTLRTVITKEGQIMTDVATVAADFDKYKTDVAAAFARLQASVDAGNVDAQALADLDTAINGADADANAEDPAPVTPPVDGE